MEWNQRTSDVPQVTEPVYLTGEIIEIGAVKLNEKFQIIDEFSIYIQPRYYTSMNQKITQLTKIHGNYLKKHGVPFLEAYERFQQFCGEEYSFMTWSKSDVPMLVENMQLYGLDVSSLPVSYDVQRVFDWEIMRSDRQYSLEAAMEFTGEKGEFAHDALHDSINTVKVCSHIDLEPCLDVYASRVFADAPWTCTYDTLTEILEDGALRRFVCPWCGAPVQCGQWVQLKSYWFMNVGTCEDGDEFAVYLTRSKDENGRFHVSRIFYEMNDDLWDFYQEKLEQQTAVL